MSLKYLIIGTLPKIICDEKRLNSSPHFRFDPELHGGQLISSPGDSIVTLVSPKKVTDPTLWGKIIFRPRPFSLLAKNATGGHNA